MKGVDSRGPTPRRFGGDPKDAFEFVVVSLPGFGFSERPRNQGHSRDRTGQILIELMKRLGYKKYGVQAGDIGMQIGSLMALRDPGNMAGLHLNQCIAPPPDPEHPNTGLTPEEIALRERARLGPDETGYSGIQGTKPQTLIWLSLVKSATPFPSSPSWAVPLPRFRSPSIGRGGGTVF